MITGLVYPLAMTGIAGVVFPYQAQGSLIEKDGKVIGSELIGQEFASDEYFHGRPSATNAPDPKDPTKTVAAPYNAANSMGSNLGPTNKALIDRVKGDVEKLSRRTRRPRFRSIWSRRRAAAWIPTSRRRPLCSRCRALPRRATCRKIASASSSQSTPRGVLLGLLGEPRVNVLALNLALDRRRHAVDAGRLAPPHEDDRLMADQRRDAETATLAGSPA